MLLGGDGCPRQKRFVEVNSSIVRELKTKSPVGIVCRYEVQKNICQFGGNLVPKFFGRAHGALTYS